ncbi:Olfactory receptor 481 [Lemmus lemmus]
MVTEFIILGLTDSSTLLYIVTLLGNISIILLIRSSPQLHTPMYLFLSHLAFVDIGYSTSVTPIMLISFLREKTTIPLPGCAAQLGSDVAFGTTECFLLATMAYDRYVAICSPLLYSTQMSPAVCFFLLGASYLGGCMNASSFTGCFVNLNFCGPNKINHFFCDLFPLVKLSCGHAYIAEISPSISSASVLVSTLSTIIVSYIYILLSIIRMRSTEGRNKAFSTCTSHLTASNYSADQVKVASVIYTVVIPMLNPLIYSLRNKEVKEAMKKLMARTHWFP